jgi:hypothetical protein
MEDRIKVLTFAETTENGHAGVIEAADGSWRIYVNEAGEPVDLHVPLGEDGRELDPGVREDLRPLIAKRLEAERQQQGR